jgi:hypothetical protein
MAAPATVPALAPAPPQRAARRPADRGGLLRGITAQQGTPGVFRALMALLVVLSLAWGAFGAWTVATHSSAASSLAHVNEQASYDAQQLYLAVANADVTITEAFLTDAQPVPPRTRPPSTLAQRQQFERDIDNAGGYLADLENSSSDPRFTAAVSAFVSGLADYKGYVSNAETEYAHGYLPTGDSFMQDASEDAHLTLLPQAKMIYQIELNAVDSSKSEATSLPTLLIALVVAVVALLALLWGQRETWRRTRRVFNVGLLVATAALVISGGWLAVTFGLATSDLGTAIGQGANPAESLAQASIEVQQIRGDSILNVIARSGTPSLPGNAKMLAVSVGPGQGSLLDSALAAGNAQAAPYVQAAISEAPDWYGVNNQGYDLGGAPNYNYAAEQTAVETTEASGYTSLISNVSKALGAAQDTFTSQADAGASAFGPLEAVVIIASLLMAGACAWGLSRRLAEYR